MSNAGKLVKSLVKTKKESVMGKLGDSPFDDPMEPWSAKYNAPVKNEETDSEKRIIDGYKKKYHPDEVKKQMDSVKSEYERRHGPIEHQGHEYASRNAYHHGKDLMTKYNNLKSIHKMVSEDVEQLDEDSWLFAYIRSMGYNPKVMSFAQRSKYARSNAFKHYKQSHMQRTNPAMESTEVEEDQLDEAGTGLLMTYIKAKGLNPLTMDGNQKHSYARSSEFKIFKHKHNNIKKEEFDRLVETYGIENLLDIVMQNQELQETSGMGERGEDWNEETGSGFKVGDKVKPNIGPHKGHTHEVIHVHADGSVNIRPVGLPGRNAYRHGAVSAKAHELVREEADKADTVTMDIPLLIRVLEYAREDAKTDMDLHKVVENLIKMRDQGTLSMSEYDSIVAIKEGFEKLDEVSAGLLNRYKEKAKKSADELHASGNYGKAIKRYTGVMKATGKGIEKTTLGIKKALGRGKITELKKMPDNMDADDHITRESVQVQEGIGGIEDSPMSATNSVKAMESAQRSKRMKSARMIKSLYKNKIKETTYDWEKDDKPNAKIVMKGGTTMTGQPRDTVEIEPVLKTRPNSAKPSN